jgi:proteic killer suppression protein
LEGPERVRINLLLGRRSHFEMVAPWLRDFFVEDIRYKKIPSDLESCLFRKIQMIDDATTDQDLRVPPSNHFEWRRVFQWDGGRGEATVVYLDDHSYR